MIEKQWRSRMMRRALVMVPLGVALMGVGAFLASGPDGLNGYVVGAIGCFVLVLGALFAKFSAFGPLPASLTRESP